MVVDVQGDQVQYIGCLDARAVRTPDTTLVKQYCIEFLTPANLKANQ